MQLDSKEPKYLNNGMNSVISNIVACEKRKLTVSVFPKMKPIGGIDTKRCQAVVQ